ncbi:MAG: ATPase, T2SS/T4P/T4SS family [Candidatus Kerfeldbacteria bacterium]
MAEKKKEFSIDDYPSENMLTGEAQFSLLHTDDFVVVDVDNKRKRVVVATENPETMVHGDFLQERTGLKPEFIHAPRPHLERLRNSYYSALDHAARDLSGSPLDLNSSTGLTELQRIVAEGAIQGLIDDLFAYGIFRNASSIHIEPNEDTIHVRYRIQGELFDVTRLPISIHAILLGHLKSLARLPLNSSSATQTAVFDTTLAGKTVNMRLSVYGSGPMESAVLKIEYGSRSFQSLQQLGMSERQACAVEQALERPDGMIIVTGPAGSGVTTTLYTMVRIMTSPSVAITVLEHYAEARLGGATQVQISQPGGLSEEAAAATALDQDQDIIVIDPLRDPKAMVRVLQYAVHSGLVVAGMEQPNGNEAFFTLEDNGATAEMINAALHLTVSQRLVRAVCEECRISIHPSAEQISALEKAYGRRQLKQLLRDCGELSHEQTLNDLVFYTGSGCARCENTGYYGSLGVFAVSEHATLVDEPDRRTVAEDALLKAKHGLTSIEEAVRIARRSQP